MTWIVDESLIPGLWTVKSQDTFAVDSLGIEGIVHNGFYIETIPLLPVTCQETVVSSSPSSSNTHAQIGIVQVKGMVISTIFSNVRSYISNMCAFSVQFYSL